MPRTQEEAAEMLDRAVSALDERRSNGVTQFPDLTYEDGVVAALNWLLGIEDEPIENAGAIAE